MMEKRDYIDIVSEVSTMYTLAKYATIIFVMLGLGTSWFIFAFCLPFTLAVIPNNIDTLVGIGYVIVILFALYKVFMTISDYTDYCEYFVASKKRKLFYATASFLGAMFLLTSFIVFTLKFNVILGIVMGALLGIAVAMLTYKLDKLYKILEETIDYDKTLQKHFN